jgi:hypothetical protein
MEPLLTAIKSLERRKESRWNRNSGGAFMGAALPPDGWQKGFIMLWRETAHEIQARFRR